MFIQNRVRTYAYLARVFKNQQADPFCRACKALVNSVTAARESLTQMEADRAEELRGLPPHFAQLLIEAQKTLASISLPENAAGQKKAGNCRLPEGVCFVKTALAVLQKL